MRRSSTILVVLVLGVFLSACGEGGDFDASDLRDIIDVLQDLEAESAGGDDPRADSGSDESGSEQPRQDPDGSGSDESESEGPRQDPDWHPPDIASPPGEPAFSEDTSDSPDCLLSRCGEAVYTNDGEDIRDHYEDVFGRPPDVAGENEEGAEWAGWEDADAFAIVETVGDAATKVRVGEDAPGP